MKLSVAMITYNQENYIGEAIESILTQRVTFEYEIVIGEDYSTDGTRSVVMDFQRRYPDRIRLILRDHNVGPMRNFVETIEACTGEYLAFLEGDDHWITPDKLQKQADFLDANPQCAICCARVRAQYEAGTDNVDFRWDIFPPRPPGSYTLEDIVKGNFIMTCTLMLRQRFVGQLPEWFFTVKLGDWPLCAMVARYGTIYLMDEIMAAYRIHPQSTWSSLAESTRSEEVLRMMRALKPELGPRYSPVMREAIRGVCLQLVYGWRSRGGRAKAVKYFIYYLYYDGWRRLIKRTLFGVSK